MAKSLAMGRHTFARPFGWIKPPDNAPEPSNLVLFRNGILDFASGKLLPYDGAYFVTGCPDYDYDAKATCPLWEATLSLWLDKSSIATVQEFFGYAMTYDVSHQALLALIGTPGSGKSTLVHLLSTVCGACLTASRTPKVLGENFGLQGVEDKRLLLIPDASDAEITKRSAVLNTLKAISGGDAIPITRKYLPPLDSIIVPARIVLVSNQELKMLDESGAFAERALPIRLTKGWRNDPAHDPHLVDKLVKELPGIANWALRGLRRLRANEGFTKGAKLRKEQANLALSQSPIQRFARDYLAITGGKEFVDTDDMYTGYRYWALEEEHLAPREIRSRQEFNNDLLAAFQGRGLRHGQERPPGGGPRKRGWWGVTLKPKYISQFRGETEDAESETAETDFH